MYVSCLFKQKTADELRISDWSSDVCSSDLALAEILLGEDVAGDLRPRGGHLDVFGAEHEGTVRVADLARGPAEFDLVVNLGASFRETTRNTHFGLLQSRFCLLTQHHVADGGPETGDRKSVGQGKSVSVRVDLGGCRNI